ncbi:glycosyltransferase family 4 protein [Gynuella sunshinyii]|uniref:Glycosyltransferase n=1 Tax=Gynuella sunshinyii YC6258 TaxID=1445510 RepID=A0A0C5VF82_9GAMM|nr:glycosyltransferase family 4 protein [Gynuella sunshinyii]AJQ92811.1 glycosyltransferase [Gynuella sunshinyii YC6258]
MKIAYLAPEIPALSATFVYNEILCLQRLGTEVIPFSIHRPKVEAQEPSVENLKANTRYLYERSKFIVAGKHLRLIFGHPRAYFSGFGWLVRDMIQLGLVNRGALGLAYRFFFAAALADDLRRTKVQHLHVHFAHVPTDVAMYASVLAGIRFSVTAHANDLFERGWLLKEKVRRSAFFATISEFNVRFLRSLGADVSRINVIRCGVDDDQFPANVGINTKKPDAHRVVGVIGRMVEKKGMDLLIKAIYLLCQRNMDVELRIAGSGPLEQELRNLVYKHQLENQVKFLGPIAHNQVSEFLTSLDLFVLPCRKDSNGDMDGIPVVLMEAMLSGIPVVSTRLSGIPELVVDQQSGLLVDPEDEASLADAIAAILQDLPMSQRLTQNAISLIRQEFSLSGNTEKLNRLFYHCVQQHSL